MIHIVLIAVLLLLLNLCWLCVSLQRRVRSLELLGEVHERRLRFVEMISPRSVRVTCRDLGICDRECHADDV